MKSFRDQPCATCGKTIKKDADMKYDGRAHHLDCEPLDDVKRPTVADLEARGWIVYDEHTKVEGLLARMQPKGEESEGMLF